MGLLDIKDTIIRKIATSFLLKWLDGYKTQVFRGVQIINTILVVGYLVCPQLPIIQGFEACYWIDLANAQWLALSVLLGQFGLELGIQDAAAKKRLLK